MREILFRGKRLDMDAWEEGFYAHLKDVMRDRESHRIYNRFSESDCGAFYPEWYEVDPATVGQYTGRTDKNGKKIFEGDIIKAEWGYQGEVDFDSFIYAMMESTIDDNAEIIGNIHDNPELLAKEAER